MRRYGYIVAVSGGTTGLAPFRDLEAHYLERREAKSGDAPNTCAGSWADSTNTNCQQFRACVAES
jgi:hypothetical protein